MGELRLTFRERIALQRSNLYGFGLILLLVTATGMVPFMYELIAIAVAYGILAIPVRYRLTSDGIALNNVVFRRWEGFQRVSAEKRSIRLTGVERMRDFQMYAQGEHQEAALAMLQRGLPNLSSKPRRWRPCRRRRRRLSSTPKLQSSIGCEPSPCTDTTALNQT